MSDYLESLCEARDALRAVLVQTEPGTGLMLHRAYSELKSQIKEEEEGVPKAKAEPPIVRPPRWNEKLTVQQRERQVLAVLTEHQMTVRQLAERLRNENPDVALYDSYVRSIIARLWKAREVGREAETFNKTRTRYRYFRRTDLEGPIADLDRAFQRTES